MDFIIGVGKVVFLLGFLILIHEGGHFIAAKLCKVRVKQFSIGFGPKILIKQGKETKYTVRAIPLGGFVEMLGETERVEEEGAFFKAKLSNRFAIVMAGPVVNIIFGILVYFLLMAISGVNTTTIIKTIIPEYITSDTVLQVGDKIIQIDEQNIRTKSDIDNMMLKSDGKDLNIIVNRYGKKIQLLVKPIEIQYGNISRFILGIEVEQAPKNFKNNLYYAFWETEVFLKQTGNGLKQLIMGKAEIKQMTGPIGISRIVVKNKGVYNFVYLFAIISLSLGITNLFPIPALDGGRILLFIIEAIRRKPLSEELELKIQSLGFSFLILLSIYVSINDLFKLF